MKPKKKYYLSKVVVTESQVEFKVQSLFDYVCLQILEPEKIVFTVLQVLSSGYNIYEKSLISKFSLEAMQLVVPEYA